MLIPKSDTRLVLLFLAKVCAVYVLAFLISLTIPYLGDFPYRPLLETSGVPAFFSHWASFDGVHYINIAKEGYHQYDQAFFPLYPITIRAATFFWSNSFVQAGLIISVVSSLVAIIFARKILELLKVPHQEWILAVFVAFPTAFFMQALYTESLFIALTFASLYSYLQKRRGMGSVLAILASLTRLQGIFMLLLFIPIEIGIHKSRGRAALIRALPFLLSPLYGLFVYMGYLYLQTGDALFFLTSQPMFGAQRSTEVVLLPQVMFRYAKIFVTADMSRAYLVAVLEFSMTIIALLAAFYQLGKGLSWRFPIRKKLSSLSITRISVAVYSMAHIVLPSLTGTLSSTPRYALMSFATYFCLAEVKPKFLKIILLVTMAIFQCVLAAFFIQGYFIS